MPLVVTTSLIVLGVMVIVGAAAYLIDESTERHERTRER
jgi:preprotein translocase subunit SecE